MISKGGPAEKAPKGIPQQGRPNNSKDSKKRKTKEFKPKTKATLAIWVKDAQLCIANELNSLILHKYNKKNLRSLSSEESCCAEELRFSTLCAIEPLTELNSKSILSALQHNNNFDIVKYNKFISDVRSEINRELTIDEIRDLQVSFYIDIYKGV